MSGCQPQFPCCVQRIRSEPSYPAAPISYPLFHPHSVHVRVGGRVWGHRCMPVWSSLHVLAPHRDKAEDSDPGVHSFLSPQLLMTWPTPMYLNFTSGNEARNLGG